MCKNGSPNGGGNGKGADEACFGEAHASVKEFFSTQVPWRGRLLYLAMIVGLLCGIVAALYEMVMDYVLEKVWKEGGDAFLEMYPWLPPWTLILVVCIPLGGVVGALIRLLGEPMANLPGVVLAAHRDGLLGHEEAPAMAAISIASIVGGGSLGPEAPLVSIGGGLASLVSIIVDLSEAETLFVTMCGMGAGLAAFFGEPVGGALFACEVIHRWGLEYYEAVIPTVVAGLSCNLTFRVIAQLPQKPIWHFAPEADLLPWTSTLGLFYGALGGGLGWLWMRGTNKMRVWFPRPFKLGNQDHIMKGLLGGLIIGICGVLFPETLFWAEFEAQTIISGGEFALPHANPRVGIFGEYSLTSPLVLFAIGLVKLFAISITVLAGYRGGFIFPFMFAGHSIGMGLHYSLGVSAGAAALSCACAINVAVTRTVLATPIVLSTISGRVDCFPTLLVSSLVALYVSGGESIIKAARNRFLRSELDGADVMVDGDATIARRRSRMKVSISPTVTPDPSGHAGSACKDISVMGAATPSTPAPEVSGATPAAAPSSASPATAFAPAPAPVTPKAML